ncbi:nucleotidyltransferase family protein [Paenibacillus rigui]|uniref:MobA-like NTP transferase domain-containing protein n=1 Tax=Paenibacillus rigui TaxID=554312 RepID=A0A229UWR4_9BACL|nr:nucleotidyltransferase family protein [Paenibacillus rigui]OXM87773.1 hypothetical protein CF651_01250 [Paenibacillus rigui]
MTVIAGIYLAAGQSRRMGSAKLGLTVEIEVSAVKGSPAWARKEVGLGEFAWRQLRNTSLCPVIAVTKPGECCNWLGGDVSLLEGEECPSDGNGAGCFNKNAFRVVCPEAERGMAYSIRCGIAAALRFKPEAVVIVLADQPLVNSEMIERLIFTYRHAEVRPSYVASGDRGKPKPPLLFGHDMFDALQELEGDLGARRLLVGSEYSGVIVEEPEQARFFDVDTPEDWEEIKQILKTVSGLRS